MAKLAAFPEPMNVAQFSAFYGTRPDGEKWELLDGELFLNASPVSLHQWIVDNITRNLYAPLRSAGGSHVVMSGIGVQISDVSSVEPDAMIRPRSHPRANICTDVVVAFEVLSSSTLRNDLHWKRAAYTKLSTLTHYLVVSPERIEVRVFSRSANWAEQTLSSLEDRLSFDSLAATLTLAQIYEDITDMLEKPKS